MPYNLTENDITSIALGNGFLGSGGGGDTKIGEIITKKVIRDQIKIEVVDIHEIADEAWVAAVGMMGAPTVFIERLPSTEEGLIAIKKMEEIIGQTINYLIPTEIGGMNGLYAVYLAAQSGKAIIDGDCMGRAFPEIQMVMPNIYGKVGKCMAVMAAGQECKVLFAENLLALEIQARQKTIEMGGVVTLVYLPMQGKDVRAYCVPNSISVSKKIGDGLRMFAASNWIEVLNTTFNGTQYGPLEQLINGEIIELYRTYQRGFNKGWVIVQDINKKHELRIDFQNENLRVIDVKTKEECAIVPKIITIVDNEFRPVSCECLRMGLEVSVLSLQVPEALRTKKALTIIGPAAFNLEN